MPRRKSSGRQPKRPAPSKPDWIQATPIKAPFNAPWLPLKPKKADVAALQAWGNGKATADQQIRAFGYVLKTICDLYGMSYRPGADGDRDTSFAEGRRFVGNQILAVANTPLSKIKEEKPGG